MKNVEVKYILSGKVKSYEKKEKHFESGYVKKEEYKTTFVTKNGLKDDGHADKKHHGGEDKALLIASTNHFKTFEDKVGTSLDKAIFSANIFLNDIDESCAYVGDIYKIGEVIVQVTQPRQPCWKIGAIFSKEASKFIKEHSATGWYVKVIQEGNISQYDKVELVERKCDITIKEMSQYLDTKKMENSIIQTILNSDFIAQSYKDDILLLQRTKGHL